jgi:TPR repeat protein
MKSKLNPKPKQYEADEQAALFTWAKLQESTYPELSLMYAIPNGGSRHVIEAANLKRQGVKAGVPDICLPVLKGHYAGLYIELKVGKNKVSEKQSAWIEKLRNYGHKAEVCYGWEEAKDVIINYLT